MVEVFGNKRKFNPNNILLGSNVEVYSNGVLLIKGTLNQIKNPHDWEINGTIYTLSDSMNVSIENDTIQLFTMG